MNSTIFRYLFTLNIYEMFVKASKWLDLTFYITHWIRYELTHTKIPKKFYNFLLQIKLRVCIWNNAKGIHVRNYSEFLGVKADITPHYNNDYWLTSQEVSLPINLGLIKVGNDAERGDVVLQPTVVIRGLVTFEWDGEMLWIVKEFFYKISVL